MRDELKQPVSELKAVARSIVSFHPYLRVHGEKKTARIDLTLTDFAPAAEVVQLLVAGLRNSHVRTMGELVEALVAISPEEVSTLQGQGVSDLSVLVELVESPGENEPVFVFKWDDVVKPPA